MSTKHPFDVRRSATVSSRNPEEARRKYVETVVDPALAAARVVSAAEGAKGLGEYLDLPELISHLREQAMAVSSGDLSRVEASLMNQAAALEALFARLTERAMGTTHLPTFEGFMRMALRSQAQCRAALETLAAIKNPPLVYARQANISNGPQQINNGPLPRAQEIEIEQTQLSGESHELLPDTRASSITGRADKALEAVGAINRAANSRG